MKAPKGKRFIPSFIFSSAVMAVLSPYLAILLRDLGYSPFWVGVLLGIYNGAGIGGPLLLGYWADKTGHYRPAILISCLLPAVAIVPVLLWVQPLISAIFLALIAIGIRSSVSLIDAITTIQIGRSGNYGQLRVWGSISFIFVTLFMQWTPFLKPDSALNIGLWLIVVSVMSIIPIILLPSTMLKTSHEHHEEEANGEKSIPVFSMFALAGFGMIFGSCFSMASIFTYLPLYVTEVLQWDAVGLLFAIAAVSEVPFMFIAGSLIRRFGALPMLAVSCIGVAVRILILAFLPYKPFIIISQLLNSLTFGTFYPSAMHFIASIFSARKRAVGMSVYAIISGLSALIGNVIGGAIVENAGYKTLYMLYATVMGFVVIVYFVMKFVRRR